MPYHLHFFKFSYSDCPLISLTTMRMIAMTNSKWIRLPTDEANDKPSAQSTTKIKINATTQSIFHQPDNKSRRFVCDSTALWRAFFSRPRPIPIPFGFVPAYHFLPRCRMLPTPKAPAVQTNATNHSIFPLSCRSGPAAPHDLPDCNNITLFIFYYLCNILCTIYVFVSRWFPNPESGVRWTVKKRRRGLAAV